MKRLRVLLYAVIFPSLLWLSFEPVAINK